MDDGDGFLLYYSVYDYLNTSRPPLAQVIHFIVFQSAFVICLRSLIFDFVLPIEFLNLFYLNLPLNKIKKSGYWNWTCGGKFSDKTCNSTQLYEARITIYKSLIFRNPDILLVPILPALRHRCSFLMRQYNVRISIKQWEFIIAKGAANLVFTIIAIVGARSTPEIHVYDLFFMNKQSVFLLAL